MVAGPASEWQTPRWSATGGPTQDQVPSVSSSPMPPPDWIRRFTAVEHDFPVWSPDDPDTLAFVSNRSGSRQVWTHRLSDGSWAQLSTEPIGVDGPVWVLPDGRFAWWSDTTGNERGRLVVTGEGESEALFPDLPEGWLMGLAFVGSRCAITIEVDGTYVSYLIDAGRPPRELWATSFASGVGRLYPTGGGLSSDGSLVVVRHAEAGDILHFALRAFDADSGDALSDLIDPGANLEPDAWSPVPGDQRLAFTSELGRLERPAIWDVATRERRDIVVDLPGAVFPIGWWPDAATMLVRHELEGRAQLYRLDPETGAIDLVADPHADIEEEGGAAIRPDGSVWFKTSDAARASRIVSPDGEEILPSDPNAPPGRAYRSFSFDDPSGDRVHAWVVTPDGEGPFPTVMSVHGGPEWHERDRYDPETLAFVDAGYAVILVNYRGSTGYGVPFRRALIGNVCFTETEDIIACLDALEADGVVDPERVFWSGWSWGGCLACFNAGIHPDRWRAIFAGIPAGDFVAAHHACAPELQAWDLAVYGGSPEEVPDAYRRSDPMTYVGNVKAPTLVIAGENDPRCPLEGVTPWVDGVRANGVPVEVELYPAGHHANGVEAQIRHMSLILDFFARNGGPPAPR
jgi:dipeptidyl aminopeptidase/acylaminoacyl peptidase